MQRSPTCYVVSVLAIVDVHRTIAIVPWIFMQAIVSQKRAHMPLRHEVAPCEGTRGLEGWLCRSCSSGCVLDARPRPVVRRW